MAKILQYRSVLIYIKHTQIVVSKRGVEMNLDGLVESWKFLHMEEAHATENREADKLNDVYE